MIEVLLEVLIVLGAVAAIFVVAFVLVQIGIQLVEGYDDGNFENTPYGYDNDHPNPVYAWFYDVGWWLGVKAAEREERAENTREERLASRRAKYWRAGDRND